jgi:hypothetical protein
MSELVRLDLEQGGSAIVEVEETFGVERATLEDEVVKAGKRLNAALAAIRPTAQAISEALGALAPDEQQVQFGMKLNGEAGLLIARTAVEGHFHVTLTWRKQQEREDPR